MKKLKCLAIACLLFASPLAFAAGQKPNGKFELSSSAFAPNGEIPLKYTCAGSDINPPLEIKNIPSKTRSLALTVQDPDAPEGVWVHWVVYNLPPDKTKLPENFVPQFEALNDYGKYHYAGPCPTDDKPHHYVFRAYALDVVLPIDEGMTIKDLEKAMAWHIIAKTELTGIYRRPIW